LSGSVIAGPNGTGKTTFAEKGYRAHFFFLWVDGLEVTLSRIRERESSRAVMMFQSGGPPPI
jgi:predicted ABC-type ATPase